MFKFIDQSWLPTKDYAKKYVTFEIGLIVINIKIIHTVSLTPYGTYKY